MSEYQYYEFAAIDKPLTRTEMVELRAVSTRAVITPSGFTNHYEWGDLKADPADWMRRYFDAFVYSANWCSCHLSLRVPKAVFRKTELEPFAHPFVLSIEATETHWIIGWALEESEDDDRFAQDDGSGWMRRLIPLRDELMRGDLRPLYLGWLAVGEELLDDMLEPDVPSGLTDLSPAQKALAEFLEIDQDLLEAASMNSAAATSSHDETLPISTWLDTWQTMQMQDVLKTIALGRGQEAERQVKSRYAAWLKAQRSASLGAARRQVAELRELAQSAAATRQAREAQAHEKREAERRQKREAELRWIMDSPDKYWKAASEQASRGSASGYEKTVSLLKVLAEGYALVASSDAFDRQLRRFLVPHAKRAALLRRLAEAGLWSG
ncbi:hypothetical protein [Pigmentiphaga sp. D-2]|uniref:hypothetical protein n=1 Tax=Pigmentiphaga sp. D-2 TaxID=1002116 RepID=UPI001048B832|nr:hypothetical protein [Pigmentiphaga sp. D-2]